MQVHVNGESMAFEGERLSVSELLESLAARGTAVGKACAVEVNRRVAPRRDHGTTYVVQGDEVEIVTLVGGG